MSDLRLFDIDYAESGHHEHDRVPVIPWDAAKCPKGEGRAISEAIRALNIAEGPTSTLDAKWSKVLPAKLKFYVALIDLSLAGSHDGFNKFPIDMLV
jgi:hypothetical protein